MVETFVSKKKYQYNLKFHFILFLDFVLLITHLNLGLDLLDGEDGMQAIASLCPHLESIYLNGMDRGL